MTIDEFSNEFDVLLNSYAITKNFGVGQGLLELDEYEKSVLLTEAQEEIVRELYNGKLTGEGFESTEEQRRNLSSLITTNKFYPIDAPVEQSTPAAPVLVLDNNSTLFQLPSDVWFITYEAAKLSDETLGCKNNIMAEVVPVRQDEYNIIKNNPFRGPSDKRVLRIDTGMYYYNRDVPSTTEHSDINIIELISKYNIAYYFIKYLKRPNPIVLVNLGDDQLSINGQTEKSIACELPPSLHRLVIERAVSLAIKRTPSNKSNV